MSGYQRMIAIPQEEYIQLKSMQYVKQPEAQKMSELAQLHQEQAQVKDPYAKLMLQGETLDEMKDLKDRMREELSLGTPKPYRNRALSLFRSIEPHIKFSRRGEIMDDQDQPIEHSRVEDLIQHAVRDRRRHFTPTAWDIFLKLLKKYNIPRSILNRDTLDELDQRPTLRRRLSFAPRKRLPPDTPPSKIRRSMRVTTPSSRYPATDFLKNFE